MSAGGEGAPSPQIRSPLLKWHNFEFVPFEETFLQTLQQEYASSEEHMQTINKRLSCRYPEADVAKSEFFK